MSYEHSIRRERSLVVWLSAGVAFGHEANLDGRLVFDLDRPEPQGWSSFGALDAGVCDLRLRLIRIERPNHSPLYLVTSVLDEKALTARQIGQFYRMRWGHEVFYRSFKQTLDQHKMRSASPQEAKRELDWALLAYLMIGLWSVEALIGAGHDPLRWSPAESLRVVRRAMCHSGRFRRRADLRVLLRQAVKDGYTRRGSKRARDWPHKKNDPPAGVPKIRVASEKEKNRARRMGEQTAA